MKNLMLITVFSIAFSMQSCSQKSDSKNTPDKVLLAFNTKFPDAKKVEWEMENNSEWEAEFKWNGKEYSANFSADGTWKETEHKIEKSDIPAAAKQTLDKEFAGYDIEDAEISETADGKVYEFELEKGETDLEVAFSLDGKVVKKEVKEEESDDEEDDND